MSVPVPRIVPTEERGKKRWWVALGGTTFWISVLLHVGFGAAAAYIVVQHFSKQHVDFVATPPPSAQVEVEHKVELAKKNNVESAPPDLKRITTTAISPIALPEVPVAAPTEESNPLMSGTGDVGQGMGGGNGRGDGNGSASPFGSFDSPTPVLQGYLYDLKQTASRKPTGMSPGKYHQVLTNFVGANWSPRILEDYYKAKKPLNTSSIFVPIIPAVDGPKAFGVESEVAPKMYVAWYKVTASPPQDGVYYFAGVADDILAVRVNGETVLDACLKAIKPDLWKDEKRVPYDGYTGRPGNTGQGLGLYLGKPMQLKANTPVEIDILIGEEPGGWSDYFLYAKRDDGTYIKQSNGSPLWPIFQIGSNEVRPKGPSNTYPPFSHNSEPWQAAKADDLH